jgi:hypothetical protein
MFCIDCRYFTYICRSIFFINLDKNTFNCICIYIYMYLYMYSNIYIYICTCIYNVACNLKLGYPFIFVLMFPAWVTGALSLDSSASWHTNISTCACFVLAYFCHHKILQLHLVFFSATILDQPFPHASWVP